MNIEQTSYKTIGVIICIHVFKYIHNIYFNTLKLVKFMIRGTDRRTDIPLKSWNQICTCKSVKDFERDHGTVWAILQETKEGEEESRPKTPSWQDCGDSNCPPRPYWVPDLQCPWRGRWRGRGTTRSPSGSAAAGGPSGCQNYHFGSLVCWSGRRLAVCR